MTTRPRTPARPGAATVELVMVFPLLVLLGAGIFLIARSGVAKATAGTAARHHAWAARPAAAPGEIFRLTNDPAASIVSDGKEVAVSPGPVFRGAGFRAESAGFATGREWDSRDVPFDHVNDFRLHTRPYRLVADNVPGGSAAVSTSQLAATALNPDADPLLLGAAAVGSVGNPLVRAAGLVLKAIGTALSPAKAVLQVLRAAARASFRFRFAAYLGRVIALLDLATRSFDNLERASRGAAVENPGGLGALRVP